MDNSSPTPQGSEPIRAFLAVDLPAEVHAAVVRLKRELAATLPGVRWVRDEGLHVTVKFLGNVAIDQIDTIRGVLAPIISRLDAFTVRVHGLGAVPSLRRPRIIWIGLNGPALAQLATVVDTALAPLGFPPEERPFRSHVTLGRIAAPQAWARNADALKSHASDDFGTCRIASLAAYRSTLQREGAVYSRLWTIELIEREGGCHGDGSKS